MISMLELGWVAGLLEGEGYFGHRRNGDLVIQIVMTDKDVIDRLFSTLHLGASAKQRKLPSGKTAYGWNLTNQAQAAGLMMTLLPLMGGRRSAKIIECLERWKAKRPWKLGPTCNRGHELSGDNLHLVDDHGYIRRRCKACAKLRTRKYRAKQEKPPRAPRILATHCKYGHELSGNNLAIARDGKYEYRGCRECNRLKQQKHRAKFKCEELNES